MGPKRPLGTNGGLEIPKETNRDLGSQGYEMIPVDAKEAVQWYQMAAINGDPAAQYNLGVMYAKGDGVEKDYVKAVRWWQRSAKQGFKQAKNVLHMLSTER